MASGLGTLGDDGVGATGDGPRGLVDGRHHRQETRSRGARRLGDGLGVVECRDDGGARREPGLDERDGGRGRRRLDRLLREPELAPERLQHLEDALALTRRRRRLRELCVDAERTVRRQFSRAR